MPLELAVGCGSAPCYPYTHCGGTLPQQLLSVPVWPCHLECLWLVSSLAATSMPIYVRMNWTLWINRCSLKEEMHFSELFKMQLCNNAFGRGDSPAYWSGRQPASGGGCHIIALHIGQGDSLHQEVGVIL